MFCMKIQHYGMKFKERQSQRENFKPEQTIKKITKKIRIPSRNNSAKEQATWSKGTSPRKFPKQAKNSPQKSLPPSIRRTSSEKSRHLKYLKKKRIELEVEYQLNDDYCEKRESMAHVSSVWTRNKPNNT